MMQLSHLKLTIPNPNPLTLGQQTPDSSFHNPIPIQEPSLIFAQELQVLSSDIRYRSLKAFQFTQQSFRIT